MPLSNNGLAEESELVPLTNITPSFDLGKFKVVFNTPFLLTIGLLFFLLNTSF